MFDEIFRRWIDTGSIYQSDIVPILLEWDSTFHKGKASANDILTLLNHPLMDYVDLNSALNKALKYIGIKKGYEWEEVYDSNGNLMKRLFTK